MTILFAIPLVAGAVLLYFYLNLSMSGKVSTNAENPSDSTQTSDDTQAQNLRENPSSKVQTTNTDSSPNPTKDNETGKQIVQMIASTDTSGDNIFIRGGVNYPVIGGSCYVVLVGPSGRTLRKDTSVLQNPKSIDCKTISIPISELPSGKWAFTLHYESADYQGRSNEISFSI